MKICKLLAVVLAMATPVAAETEVDAYGLGRNPPAPEKWTKIDEDLSIRARVVRDKSGELADVVKRPEVLRLEVAFFARKGAADRKIVLTCAAYFMDAKAQHSQKAAAVPCYSGQLHDADGKFQPLDFELKFRPVTSDPAGTSAVAVEVTDTVINDHVMLWPTYDWQGGKG